MDNTLAMTLQPQSLTPTPEDVAMLTRQYQKALDGLFEAYQFGMMLRAVKERLDRETACGTTVEQNADGTICGRAPGLKGWLATYCPEINYSTARRFLAVAEKTVSALALAEAEGGVDDGSPVPTGAGRGEAPCASAGEGARSPFPPEAKVREFLAGKSQRAVLRLGGRREGAGRARGGRRRTGRPPSRPPPRSRGRSSPSRSTAFPTSSCASAATPSSPPPTSTPSATPSICCTSGFTRTRER